MNEKNYKISLILMDSTHLKNKNTIMIVDYILYPVLQICLLLLLSKFANSQTNQQQLIE